MSMTDDQIADVKEAFSLFDKDGDGAIPAKDVGTVMRSLCQNPTEDELNSIIAEMDQGNSGVIDFDDFLRVFQKKASVKDKEGALIEALKVFDRDNTGSIRAGELKHVIINLGEKLTDEEVEEMVKEADTRGDGVVDIKNFARMLLEK